MRKQTITIRSGTPPAHQTRRVRDPRGAGGGSGPGEEGAGAYWGGGGRREDLPPPAPRPRPARAVALWRRDYLDSSDSPRSRCRGSVDSPAWPGLARVRVSGGLRRVGGGGRGVGWGRLLSSESEPRGSIERAGLFGPVQAKIHGWIMIIIGSDGSGFSDRLPGPDWIRTRACPPFEPRSR